MRARNLERKLRKYRDMLILGKENLKEKSKDRIELRNSSEVSFLEKENLQVSPDNGDLIRVSWNLRVLEV